MVSVNEILLYWLRIDIRTLNLDGFGKWGLTFVVFSDHGLTVELQILLFDSRTTIIDELVTKFVATDVRL